MQRPQLNDYGRSLRELTVLDPWGCIYIWVA